MRREDKYPNTDTFEYRNVNPKGRITGDCVIRAISTATDIPYQDVAKGLFDMFLKTGYMVDCPECYGKYLESIGWLKHPQPKKANNTKYTGRQFCLCFKPDKCIAHIGGHHLVSIMNGKVIDHWDSTDGCIGNYWSKS